MTPASDVTIVSTGTANLASVVAAFDRIGLRAIIARDPDDVRYARRVVLPGVGAFGAAREQLRQSGMDTVLLERLRAKEPMLMICLGMQLLALASEESEAVAGFGVIPNVVRKLPEGVRLPQIGWNRVEPTEGMQFVRSGYAYFANSYCFTEGAASWLTASSEHGRPFIAAFERGTQLACQFHPELSGAWGEELLARWSAAC